MNIWQSLILLALWEFCTECLIIFTPPHSSQIHTLSLPTLLWCPLFALSIKFKFSTWICGYNLKENWLFCSQQLSVAHNSSWCGNNINFPSPNWNLERCKLTQGCVCCLNCCNFICSTALARLESTASLWPLPSFHPLFCNNLCALGGGEVAVMFLFSLRVLHFT